jgi:hypothetical protein
MTRLLLTAVLLIFTGSVLGAESWHTSRVKYVYPLADGSVVLVFVNSAVACSASGPDKYHYLSVGENGVTADGFDRIYAAALAGAAGGQVLQINFDDASSYCFVNRLLVVYE